MSEHGNASGGTLGGESTNHQPTQRRTWPEPTVDPPSLETLEEWMWEDAGCEATDSCWVEPDGVCPHGHRSWFLELGLI